MTRTPCSWRFAQRFLVLFVPCAALLGGLVVWLDASSQRTERARIEQSEGLVVALAHTALAHEFEEVVADVRLLAASGELQRALDHPRQRPDRLIAEFVALSRYRRLYEQVRLLDATGMEVVRVNFNQGQPAAVPQAELQSRGAQPYFADTFALGPGAVFVSPFERDVEQAHVARPDQPMIGVGTPVVDRQGRKRGIVLLNYDGSEFFAALARASAPAIGQMMLLNRDGLRLRGPRPEVEQSGPVPDDADRTFAQAFPAVWAQIRAAETGQITTAEGLFTFSTMYPLADAQHASTGPTRADRPGAAQGGAQAYHWKLVSRVAPAGLDARLHRGLHQSLPVALAALAVLGGGAALLARVGLKHAQAAEALRQAHDALEQRVQGRTAALATANRALADQAERLRALATEVTLAEQRERRRLATVLHDEHQQLLVAAKLQVTRLERTGDAGAQAVSRELAALLEQVLARNRSLTQELSPPVLQTGRLVPAIEWLAGRMAETHKLQIVVEADSAVVPGAEDLTVLLFEAVRELLFNVVKHAQVTTARVEIALREGQARIEVSDAGVGFDPTSPRVEGGFGLVSIRQRLEALGGRLEIDSTPGRGSRVTLWAPVQQAPVLAPPVPVEIAPPESASRPAARPPAPGRTGTIRILVVDDHQLVRQGLIRLLTAEPDLEIVGEAANGQTAVELTQQLGPDVVLMDVSMPVMNGVEATRLIRARYPTVRVIGLSMFEEAEQGQAMRTAGAAAYVSKSRAPEALVAAIRACVESTRGGEAG